jgi:hypothetical protein
MSGPVNVSVTGDPASVRTWVWVADHGHAVLVLPKVLSRADVDELSALAQILLRALEREVATTELPQTTDAVDPDAGVSTDRPRATDLPPLPLTGDQP